MGIYTALVLLTWATIAGIACIAFIVRAAVRTRAPCAPCVARALNMAIFSAFIAEAVLVAFVVLSAVGRV